MDVNDALLPGRLLLRLLSAILELVTDLLARVLGSGAVRHRFPLVLSGLVLFGPLLSFWVSKYSILAKGQHYLYRKFLRSTWGWTCIFTGSFIVLLFLSARRSSAVCLRHLSRLGVVGLLWWGCRHLLTLLEDAAGACYRPVTGTQAAASGPILVLHQDQTKVTCLRSNMVWRGYEVSQDLFILSFCCLLLLEEISIFDAAKSLQSPPGAPLRILFLLCSLLLAMWMFLLLCLLAHFPKFPSQQLGGALGYLGWRGLYQGWYRLKVSWVCPGLPGDGLLETSETQRPPQ
ncbi:fat storage-inducing transmembrane protein 1 [Sphaeramia orbicularis]|uniref:Fat storage-inducing transmembrane protein 1 homolog n=1 Tax=Sphaeramia orbicularis TaxID=375764 RepID=A0A673CJY4_9TELE|nr:fat storage-inducing transmembrane protein 1-like [Sphaeramia orbicularis]